MLRYKVNNKISSLESGYTDFCEGEHAVKCRYTMKPPAIRVELIKIKRSYECRRAMFVQCECGFKYHAFELNEKDNPALPEEQ